ncbi:MAG: queuosine salvage family protein, partial [Patescibacteria group bacterium]
MLDVLKTTKFVVDNSQSVKIHMDGIKKLCKKITKETLELGDLCFNEYDWSFSQLHYIDFVFDSLVYCFWAEKGQPKWAVDKNGTVLDGSVALYYILEKEAKTNKSFFNPDYLANFSYEDGKKLFGSETEIPLFNNRISCIREVGYVLKNKYSSDA